MKFLLLSPEKTLFDGEVNSVTVPGTKGIFTVWENHAPLLSTLTKGKVVFKTENEEHHFAVNGGFIEVKDNVISVCVEKAEKINQH